MTVCKKCGKENQPHYKFCLGCGAELSAGPPQQRPPPAAVNGAAAVAAVPSAGSPSVPSGRSSTGRAPKAERYSVASVAPASAASGGLKATATPAGGLRAAGGGGLESIATAPDAMAGLSGESRAEGAAAGPDQREPAVAQPDPTSARACGACGSLNPPEFVFCGNCGGRLQPAPQQTLGFQSESAASATSTWGKLSLIRPDGSEGGSIPLTESEVLLGRGAGPLFDGDGYLSPQHARLIFDSEQVLLEDAGSLNGVFVKIVHEEALESGSIFRIGQELLRFDVIGEPHILDDGTEIMGSPNPGYWGRLSLIVGTGEDGSAFPLMGDEMILGRERGDIIFSDDGYVSGVHARISAREDGFFLEDLGSSNGTFIRISLPRPVGSGTFILVGQQLFRLDLF